MSSLTSSRIGATSRSPRSRDRGGDVLELDGAPWLVTDINSQTPSARGASLLVSPPIDVLYSMCELNEVAWADACHHFGLGEAEAQRCWIAASG